MTDGEVAAGTVLGLNAETLQGLTADELGGGDAGDRFDELEARVDDLTAESVGMRACVDRLERLLTGSRSDDVDGRDTLQFEGMNAQVVNGTDASRRCGGCWGGEQLTVVSRRHRWPPGRRRL